MTKSITQKDRELLLAEYEPLREEVNRTVDRMTANELACCAFVFSLILFQFSTKNVTSIPDWIVIPFGASLALVVAFMGHERSKVFRRHMDQVDDYLANIERALSSQFGWTNHYRDAIQPSDARKTGSRCAMAHSTVCSTGKFYLPMCGAFLS